MFSENPILNINNASLTVVGLCTMKTGTDQIGLEFLLCSLPKAYEAIDRL